MLLVLYFFHRSMPLVHFFDFCLICSFLFFFFHKRQPIDCKRDQFRKYIESKGVIDTITKVLIKLLETPVKPEHPIDFIRDNLGPTLAEKHRIEQLEQQVADYKQEVSDLKKEIEGLKGKLSDCTTKKAVDSAAAEPSETKSDAEAKDESADSQPEAVNSGGAEPDATAEKKIIESEKAAAPADSKNVSNTEVAATAESTKTQDDAKEKKDANDESKTDAKSGEANEKASDDKENGTANAEKSK